jgi:YkoY family integral membrane protein
MFPFELNDVPTIAWYIGVLVFLEGLLSADNALVLALMVRHLPKPEQRRVLRYGIWGAIGFRVVAVLLSAILLRFWYFKVLGGGYLLYLAIKHFGEGESGTEAGRRGWGRSFWGTVVSVTLTDIAFSIDSILAAVAMADDFPARFEYNGKLFIVLVGGILGIITMRFVVRYFVILLDRFPGLAQGAYVIVAWIGLKLAISGLHDAYPRYVPFHIPEWLFWSVMLAIAVVSLLIQPRTKSPEMAESLDLLDEAESAEGDGVGENNGVIDPDRAEHEPAPADAIRDHGGGRPV